jgi:hypothetical protein
MGYETFPKKGQQGSRHVFSGEHNGGDSLTTRNNREKRDYMKSGRNEFAGKAQSSEKFKVGTESAGMGASWSKRHYPKKGHSATKFGTTKSQGS